MNDVTAASPGKLKVARLFTTPGRDPYDNVKWVKRDAVISSPDGKEKFRQNDVEVPSFWSERATNIVAEKYFRVVNGAKETSARDMIARITVTIAKAGIAQGLFEEDDAAVFEAELRYMMVHQLFAFNSPVWFNVGVVENPQSSACFVQAVRDTMEDLTQLQAKEVRLFKGGSGTGANLSPLRSSYEQLSGGGYASGPVSFMQGFDAWAGITKSGGTTRRAAKMVMLNADHPDILTQKNGTPGFVTCKAHAEKVARDLFSTGLYTAEFNVPGNVYELVPFQNANNSVRVSNAFMQAMQADGEWQTKKITNGEVVHNYRAKELWREIVKAAWFCGDPGLQFDDTINEWHTCKASGRINGSNPCSEYMFLDNSACNLGSLNLLGFMEGSEFNVTAFAHACQIAITAMETLVDLSGYPGEEIGENARRYRPLGLGYANLGALLFTSGIAYDSQRGRDFAASVTALMSGAAYAQSARIASVRGPFAGYPENRDSMLEVIDRHAAALNKIEDDDLEFEDITNLAEYWWTQAQQLGDEHGFRNAQISVLAPTGTISFLMDCDSTGVEPFIALVSYKKLVGGGTMKMTNRLVKQALETLGYAATAIEMIAKYVEEQGDVTGCSLLRPADMPVFATAIGENAIAPEGHIKMMAAVQPFIAGAISKSVNVSATTTPTEVGEIYYHAWKLGLKAIAIYRDGCKLSQPAGTKLKTSPDGKETPPELKWGERKKMPDERESLTHKMKIGNAEGYIHVGKYPDGKPGEVFITMAQEGSTLRGFVDAWATALSIGLQYGVPLQTFIDKMRHSRFEPAGFTQNPDIRMVESIPDYIGRWLEQRYLAAPPAQAEDTEVSEEKLKEAVKTGINGPPCSRCGNLTVRSGMCYVCTACGTTTGCG